MALVRPPSFFLHSVFLRTLFFGLLFFGQLQVCSAGQIFTNGLAIINSPQPGSENHAGSNMPISIDVSGDGMLPSDPTLSSSSTRFDCLDTYLVSEETSLNLTVSSDSQFLTTEQGSVRHLNFNIPTCVPTANYNLTFYELSHINGEPHFIITPIQIPIRNDVPSGPCVNGTNPYLGQPQDSSPPSSPPFSQGQGQQPTRTSGMVTSVTGSSTGSPTGPIFITVTLSIGGGLPFPFPPTVTQTQTVTASTVIVSESLSLKTITSVVEGTVTTTFVQTTTALVTTTTTSGSLSGVIPVTGAGYSTKRVTSMLLLIPVVMWSLL